VDFTALVFAKGHVVVDVQVDVVPHVLAVVDFRVQVRVSEQRVVVHALPCAQSAVDQAVEAISAAPRAAPPVI
jgi:hypothetical protein